MIETIDLKWQKDDRGFALHLRQAKSPLSWVVPDATYAGMWRIRHPGGRLTDMMSLTRAKDAAVSVALGALNPKRTTERAAQRPRRLVQVAGALSAPLPPLTGRKRKSA
jgi:hypothetical protein